MPGITETKYLPALLVVTDGPPAACTTADAIGAFVTASVTTPESVAGVCVSAKFLVESDF